MMLPRFVRALFGWRVHHFAGCWRYDQNAVTGQRRAAIAIVGGYSPLDFEWLNDGVGHPEVSGAPAWRSAQGQRFTGYFL